MSCCPRAGESPYYFLGVLNTPAPGLLFKKQVHSLCVDSRPGDRLRLAKGDPPSLFFFCQAQSEAHGPPSAMAVRKIQVQV